MGPLSAGLLLVLLALSSAAAETPATDEPRFRVEARLITQPAEIRDGRFALRGSVAPGTRPAASVGFRLRAALVAKSGPLCLGPGSVFYDGFEGLP
jgi:hypothetical protein